MQSIMNIYASANENIMKGANSRKTKITTPTYINTLIKIFLIFFIISSPNYIINHFSLFPTVTITTFNPLSQQSSSSAQTKQSYPPKRNNKRDRIETVFRQRIAWSISREPPNWFNCLSNFVVKSSNQGRFNSIAMFLQNVVNIFLWLTNLY